MTDPLGPVERDDAVQVLAWVLAQPGGGQTVLGTLAAMPGTAHTPARPRGLLRGAEPARLQIHDRLFTAADNATRIQSQHVVRGVVLQRDELGSADAARAIFDAAQRLIAVEGQPAADALHAALYGLAATAESG